MLYAILALAIVAGTAVVGVTVARFLRARRGETAGSPPAAHASSAAVAEAVAAIGAQIERAVADQSLQGETQRQLLAQKLDTVRHTVETQQNQVQGLRGELRHEARRRDDELAEIRHQIGAIQQTVGLPVATRPALPPALHDDPPALAPGGPAEVDPPALSSGDVPDDASFEDALFEDLSSEDPPFSMAAPIASTGDGAVTFEDDATEPARVDSPTDDEPPVGDGVPIDPALFTETFSEIFAAFASDEPASTPIEDSFGALPPAQARDEASQDEEEAPAEPPSATPAPAASVADPAVPVEETFTEEAFSLETFFEEAPADLDASEVDLADEPSAPAGILSDDDFVPMSTDAGPEPEDPFATAPLYDDPSHPGEAPPHGDGASPDETFADIFEAWTPSQLPSTPLAATAHEASTLTSEPVPMLDQTAWITRPPTVAPVSDFVGFASAHETEPTPIAAPEPTDVEATALQHAAGPDETVRPGDAPEHPVTAEATSPSEPSPSAERSETAEDLTAIRTIDAETQRRLREAGVRSLEEIAHWGRGDARRVSAHVGVSEETIMNQWVFEAQAALFNRYAQQAGA